MQQFDSAFRNRTPVRKSKIPARHPEKNYRFAKAFAFDASIDEAKVTIAMLKLDEILDQLFPPEQTRIIKLMVEKVIVSPNDIELRLRANERLVLELRQPAVEGIEVTA